MENIEFGRVYLIKDDEIIPRVLHTNEKQLNGMNANRIANSIIAGPTALEENGTSNFLDEYIDFLDQGYSVIRVADTFQLRYDENGLVSYDVDGKDMYIMISQNINMESYDMINSTVRLLTDSFHIEKQYIYNIHNHDSMNDYDYLDYGQTNPDYSMSEKLDVLLREKLNRLTQEEQKMMDEYRDYDLKAILTSDHLSAKINNGDAGVVVITPDKTFEKTVTKLQHGADIDWCLAQENLAYEGSIWDLVENNNTIIMQLCYGEAIIWLNSYDKRTEYQQSELTRIMTDIQQIIDSGYDLNIEAAICQNRVINKIENEEILGENNDNIKRAY